MIACLSPSSQFYSISLNTLKYANDVQNIKNVGVYMFFFIFYYFFFLFFWFVSVKRLDPKEETIQAFRDEIRDLKKQLEYWKRMAGGDGNAQSFFFFYFIILFFFIIIFFFFSFPFTGEPISNCLLTPPKEKKIKLENEKLKKLYRERYEGKEDGKGNNNNNDLNLFNAEKKKIGLSK
jgi:hypothetical protein